MNLFFIEIYVPRNVEIVAINTFTKKKIFKTIIINRAIIARYNSSF